MPSNDNKKKIFPVDPALNAPAIVFGQIGTTLGSESYLPLKVVNNGDGTATLQVGVTIGTVTIGAVKIEDASSTKKLEVLGDGEDISGVTGGFQGIGILGLDTLTSKTYYLRMETINSKWRALVDSTLKDGVGNNITSTDEGSSIRGLDVHIRGGDFQIGAVEIKNGADDTRAVVRTDGAENALVVVQNSAPLPSTAATSTKQSDGTQKTQVVDSSNNSITSKDEGSSVRSLDVNVRSGAAYAITLGKKVGTWNLTTGGNFAYTSNIAKKAKIVGIYVNIDTALARNITFSVYDGTATTAYSFVIKTADSSTQIVINDEFIIAVDEEIKLEVTANVGETSVLLNYRIDYQEL
jgi:hypothetical protein